MKVSFCRLKSEKQVNIVLNKIIFRGIYITKYFFFFLIQNLKSNTSFLPKEDTIMRKVNAAKLMEFIVIIIDLFY